VADVLFCVQFTPPPPPPFAAATPVPGSAPPVRFFSSSYGQLDRLTGKCFSIFFFTAGDDAGHSELRGVQPRLVA
jgi:hypothetical protein